MPSVDIDVINLYSYHGSFAIFRLVTELIFVIVLLYNIITICRSVYKHKCKHFTGVMSVIDLGSVSLGVLCTFIYLLRFAMTRIIISGFHKHDGNISIAIYNSFHWYLIP